MDQLLKRIQKDPLAVRRIMFKGWEEEIPKAIAQCKNLESLDVGFTDIAEIPAFVAQLPKLKTLRFYGCTALKFPDNLQDYPSLKELGVFCKTKEELKSVFKLQQLNHLTITGRFKAIPEQIGQLKNLKTLVFFGLPLTKIPDALATLPDLKELELRTVLAKLDLEHLISVLQANKKLTSLKLHTLKKPIPPSIAALSSLKELDLETNGLTQIPKEIFALSKLTHLNLGVNNLKTLPQGIGNLKQLKTLKLNSNWTNELDTTNLMNEIHLLQNLQVLHLWSCQSVKKIPESIFECKKLKELDVDNNKLEDLPTALFKMPWLKKLRLTGNKIPKTLTGKLVKALPNTKVMVD